MASKKKLLQAAAGSAGGAGLDVDEVFSTYLYEGAGGTGVTVNNGIDLSGEGGLVWIKAREAAENNVLFDTERGVTKRLKSNSTAAEDTNVSSLTNFYSTGFRVDGNGTVGSSGDDYASWTFRKAPKFFDVVTYSGNSTAGRTVSHSLGSVPGMIIVKTTNASDDWRVYHRGVDSSNPENYVMYLNDTRARVDAPRWNDTAPTSTEFTLGSDSSVNGSGRTYVAYIFAHNNSDGEFGPDSDQDIIKCGSYTGNGSSGSGPDINLGFEPQWVMIKRTDSSGDGHSWRIFDVMRGFVVNGTDSILKADASTNEAGNNFKAAHPTSTGFKLESASAGVNGNGGTYIYMAIRRGPLAAPDDATKVFEATTSLTGARQNGDTISTTLDHVDWHFARKTDTTFYNYNQARKNGWKYLSTNTEDAAATAVLKQGGDQNKLEYTGSWHGAHSNVIDYFFKRAPSFFDIVCYDGSGSNRTINHNLGVVPEMMWVKSRSNSGLGWMTYHSGTGATHYLMINSTGAAVDLDVIWNDTAPTSSVFSIGTGGSVNDSGKTYIAYLFATVAGVSKVGSYTGTAAAAEH
jgi:hypothetical protein